jgi:hypothetical protein
MSLTQDLSIVGGMLGGVLGNTIETGVDGYETCEDIRSNNYMGAGVHGIETLLHGSEAVLDGMAGDWL